jgi:hypothetical protein
LYGFRDERADIHLGTVRLAILGRMPPIAWPRCQVPAANPALRKHRRVFSAMAGPMCRSTTATAYRKASPWPDRRSSSSCFSLIGRCPVDSGNVSLEFSDMLLDPVTLEVPRNKVVAAAEECALPCSASAARFTSRKRRTSAARSPGWTDGSSRIRARSALRLRGPGLLAGDRCVAPWSPAMCDPDQRSASVIRARDPSPRPACDRALFPRRPYHRAWLGLRAFLGRGRAGAKQHVARQHPDLPGCLRRSSWCAAAPSTQTSNCCFAPIHARRMLTWTMCMPCLMSSQQGTAASSCRAR